MLRVDIETKATIKAAADSVGQSLTTFIIEAALKHAAEVKRRPPSRGVHGGVPSFFRAACHEAAHGGTNGYSNAGWNFAGAIPNLVPNDLEEDEWFPEVEKLQTLLAAKDDAAILEWFVRHYPKCMALVPTRRRDQFLEGVRRAYEDERIEL